MSRILKAPYITFDEKNCITINNHIETLKEDITKNEYYEENNNKNNISFELNEEQINNIQHDILETAREQAEQIIKNAKKEAEDIIQKTSLEMEMQAKIIFDENKEKGFNQGYDEGKNEADMLKEEANQILLNVQLEKEELQKNIEPELINLVINITQKILTNSFKFNPEIIALLIKKGLQNVKEISNIKIFVSENQFQYVFNNKNDIIGFDTEKNNIEILTDSLLSDDDCIIETPFGTIRCGANEQFKGIKEALIYLLN